MAIVPNEIGGGKNTVVLSDSTGGTSNNYPSSMIANGKSEPSSISELTNGEHSELKYSASGKALNYPFIKDLCIALRKLGYYNGQDTTEYTIALHNAVSNFQTAHMSVDYSKRGILNDNTLKKLYSMSQEAAPTTIGGGQYDSGADTYVPNDTDSDILAHYDPFFDQRNQKRFRKNKQDINIILGDGTIVKTIKDAYMRSVSVEVDASGNPISEVYEFVARDIIETDEANDPVKYTRLEDYAGSDFAYSYDFSSYNIPYTPVDVKQVSDENSGEGGQYGDNKDIGYGSGGKNFDSPYVNEDTLYLNDTENNKVTTNNGERDVVEVDVGGEKVNMIEGLPYQGTQNPYTLDGNYDVVIDKGNGEGELTTVNTDDIDGYIDKLIEQYDGQEVNILIPDKTGYLGIEETWDIGDIIDNFYGTSVIVNYDGTLLDYYTGHPVYTAEKRKKAVKTANGRSIWKQFNEGTMVTVIIPNPQHEVGLGNYLGTIETHMVGETFEKFNQTWYVNTSGMVEAVNKSDKAS